MNVMQNAAGGGVKHLASVVNELNMNVMQNAAERSEASRVQR
jgi:hypothetical protein